MLNRPSAGLGERLKRYRLMSGLSAQKLSDRLGGSISRGVIANIETGVRVDITVDELIMLAWALDVPPVALALPIDTPGALVDVHDLADGKVLVERVFRLARFFEGKDIWPRRRGARAARVYVTTVNHAISNYVAAQRAVIDAVKAGDQEPEEIKPLYTALDAAADVLEELGIDFRGVVGRGGEEDSE